MQFESLRELRLHGFAKFCHRLFLLVTYPFRHFFIFATVLLIILAIMLAIPMFHRIPLSKIPYWYTQKIENMLHSKDLVQNPVKVEKSVPQKEQKTAKFSKKIKLKHAKVKIESSQENLPQEELQHQGAVKPQEAKKYAAWKIQKQIVSEDLKEEQKVDKDANEIVEKKIFSIEEADEPVKTEEAELSFRKIDSLPLVYLDEPEIVSGGVIIYGANELYVGDTYLYLYGVYTDSSKYNPLKAKKYLSDLIDGQEITCYVVAKTKDNIATGICFKEDRNLNQSLIDAHFADNIAL